MERPFKSLTPAGGAGGNPTLGSHAATAWRISALSTGGNLEAGPRLRKPSVRDGYITKAATEISPLVQAAAAVGKREFHGDGLILSVDLGHTLEFPGAEIPNDKRVRER